MKTSTRWISIAAALLLAAQAQAGLWTDDYEQALKDAKAQSRFVLLDFTGSDWCGWCKKLDTEVFSRNEFKKYAKDNLTCVTIDFPQGFQLPTKTQRRNGDLQQKFGVKGYPTIVLLDPDGNKVGVAGYQSGGAEKYVQHLQELIGPYVTKFPKPTPGAVAPATAPAADPATNAAPATAGPEVRTWTSVSGKTVDASFNRRLGDTVTLRRADGTVLQINIESLSDADKEYLRSLHAL